MTIAMFVVVLLLAVAIGLYSRVGAGKSTADFLVGGRSFGSVVVFIMVVGEVYSIGTIIGFPGGVYAHGVGFAVWFMGYILLGYPIGYFLLPLLWKAGRQYDAMTLPDIFRGHFNSRPLELTSALVGVVFLIPWAQLQLTGLEVALNGLGLGLTPLVTVLIGVGISLVFVLLSGIRAPAFVSFLKDFALIAVILVVAGFVLNKVPNVATIITHANVGTEHTTIPGGAPMLNTVSTLLFQTIGFYMFPFVIQAVLSGKSPVSIRRTQIVMPLYMLMYPFILLTSFFAISAVPGLTGAGTNLAFIEVARQLLPGWLVGVVAGGAALCAIVVLAASALVIGTLFSRNVLTNISEVRQKSMTQVVIVVYLVISIVLTLVVPTIMGTLINTAYYGLTQLVVPVLLMIFPTRVRPGVMAAGLAVGALTSIGIYLSGATLGGLNIGVPALAANLLVVGIGRLVAPAAGPTRSLAARRRTLPTDATTSAHAIHHVAKKESHS
ncbi:sodium:solute symporter family protein [Arthrobacter dokdonensis]|uniref:sodium:solute symporter family protein n=1 Tax=Arthrobacter dokdonellae TaxID=2211210 RepID=UPI000DE5A5FE|nr:sodium:solute symporter family protein [Arthrobacter dokdonellae]